MEQVWDSRQAIVNCRPTGKSSAAEQRPPAGLARRLPLLRKRKSSRSPCLTPQRALQLCRKRQAGRHRQRHGPAAPHVELQRARAASPACQPAEVRVRCSALQPQMATTWRSSGCSTPDAAAHPSCPCGHPTHHDRKAAARSACPGWHRSVSQQMSRHRHALGPDSRACRERQTRGSTPALRGCGAAQGIVCVVGAKRCRRTHPRPSMLVQECRQHGAYTCISHLVCWSHCMKMASCTACGRASRLAAMCRCGIAGD